MDHSTIMYPFKAVFYLRSDLENVEAFDTTVALNAIKGKSVLQP